ncbi:hypothetical protein HDU78_008516 [Chytriomyces hyalinus]|nr:hypothetical protein HDU78_008516 [Chytriomyces hyalinus]
MAERFRPLCRFYDHIENIWIARDLETDNEVLLKYVSSIETPSADDTRTYQSDMEVFGLRVSSQLNPSRIINFISCYRHSGSQVVLAMEKARCSLTEALVLRPKLTENEVKSVIRCLLEALVACHSKYIVHRNVKPENMFLFSNDLDSLKLGGFGICTRDDGGSTCIGLRGSKGYIAPEQTNTKEYGRPVDIWATGVTTYQLLYKCLPYPGFTAMLRMDRPELQFPVTPKISAEGIGFIRLLLSVNPKNRPTASEALKHAWFNSTTPEIPDETPAENSHDAAQIIIPALASNRIPVQISRQTLIAAINGAIEALSVAPTPPVGKALPNLEARGRFEDVIPMTGPSRKIQWEHSVDTGFTSDRGADVASSPARVEVKFERDTSNACTLSTSNNPVTNEDHESEGLHCEVPTIASNISNHVEDESGPNEMAAITRSQTKIPTRTFSLPENQKLQNKDEDAMDVFARDPFIVANNNQNSFPVVERYAKERSDEQSLAEGDVIVLTKVFRDGWAEGVNMREGVPSVFPLNFQAPSSLTGLSEDPEVPLTAQITSKKDVLLSLIPTNFHLLFTNTTELVFVDMENNG